MEIKIGVGLDNIVFGMSQEDVKNLLGAPNKVSHHYFNSFEIYDILICLGFKKHLEMNHSLD